MTNKLKKKTPEIELKRATFLVKREFLVFEKVGHYVSHPLDQGILIGRPYGSLNSQGVHETIAL